MNLNTTAAKLLIIPSIVLLVVFLIPRKNGYQYTTLDKIGIASNVLLSIIYVLLSIAGLFTIFLWDYSPTEYSQLKKGLLYAITIIGLLIPFLSIAGILTSAITRKIGKSKLSFIIQFLPIPFFAVMLILMLLWDKIQ